MGWVKGLLIAFFVVLAACLAGIVFFYQAWASYEDQPRTFAVALGDLDGDGDLDAFLGNGKVNAPSANTVLLQQSGAQGGQAGKFRDSGQRLGDGQSRELALADFDSDGDLDAAATGLPRVSLFYNDGNGRFTADLRWDSGVRGNSSLAVGDLNGDGAPDLLAAVCCGPDEPSAEAWLNQGMVRGRLRLALADPPQAGLGAQAAALGDLDGDGDLDAFFANNFITAADGTLVKGQPDTVFWNAGRGGFSDSGQRLGQASTLNAALADLDGDGDLDVYTANGGPDEVWLNEGRRQGGQEGAFSDSGQRLGDATSRQVSLADLDGDGDLDAATVIERGFPTFGLALEIRLNDGQGNFAEASQRLGRRGAQAFTLGDLDGDGDLDAFAAWRPNGAATWWNDGRGRFRP